MKQLVTSLIFVFSSTAVFAKQMNVEGDFDAPESILHVVEQDVYLVSNMGGTKHSAQDNNGFISRIAPDGQILEARWIAGGENDVTLNAPTGMAVLDDTLWIVDYNVVRGFNLNDGAAIKNIEVPGAACLNDIAIEDNALLVSDCGLDDDFKPTGTDAIWRITPDGEITDRVAASDLKKPNGLAVSNAGNLYWVGLRDPGVLYNQNSNGEITTIELPGGSLDGIVLADEAIYISSWSGNTVYRIHDGQQIEALPDTTGAADIGWDAQRQRLLMPILYQNRLVLQDMKSADMSAQIADKETVIRAYFDIWNSQSLERLDEVVAMNIRFRDEANEAYFSTSKELIGFMQEAWQASPDIHFSIDKLLETSEGGVVEWTMTGSVEGNAYEIKGASIIEVSNGKVTASHDYFNN